MTEHGILFTAPMVRAILEGRKTQTRRLVKLNVSGRVWRGKLSWHIEDRNALRACRYGAPGDLLWVRETFRECPQDQDGNCIEYRADRPEYRKRDDDPSAIPWTPSTYMPRWASRITLKITGVRVERLQEISDADAAAEGVEPHEPAAPYGAAHITPYSMLWNAINGADSWAANPWVWVVSFERVERAKAAA